MRSILLLATLTLALKSQAARAFRLRAVGDIKKQCNGCLASGEYDAFLALGDLTYAYNNASMYDAFVRLIPADKRGVFLPVLGNHEYVYDGPVDFNDATAVCTNAKDERQKFANNGGDSGDERARLYAQHFAHTRDDSRAGCPPFWYARDLDKGRVRVTAVSSEHRLDAQSTQGAWLRKFATSKKAKWNVLAIHRPLFGVCRRDQEAALFAQLSDVLPRFSFALAGHVHAYYRTLNTTVPHVVVGTGGAGFIDPAECSRTDTVVFEKGWLDVQFGAERACMRFTSATKGVLDAYCVA